MKNKMQPAEIVKRLENLSVRFMINDNITFYDDCVAVDEAAQILRQVESGELVELSCKQCVPDGLRDCAGSKDEWFIIDYCCKCKKYIAEQALKGAE